jgi:hypothetical protein
MGTEEVGMTPKAKGKQPQPPRALAADDELFIFDIYNTFQHHWFLSQDHLMANATSAQKAEDRKFF